MENMEMNISKVTGGCFVKELVDGNLNVYACF